MNSSDEFNDIRIIADAICDGDVTPEQMQELDHLLKQSDEAKHFYLNYVGLHASMKASHDPKVEVVMRRSQIDELIVRPIHTPGPLTTDQLPIQQQAQLPSGKSKNNSNYWIIFLGLVCCGLLVYIFTSKPKDELGKLEQGRLKNLESHSTPQNIPRGEYLSETDSLLILNNASQIELKSETRFNLLDPNKLYLHRGELSFTQESNQNLRLHTQNFKLVSLSKIVQIKQHKNSTELQLNSDNKLYPARWRPIHFWSFDQSGDRAIDSAGEAHGSVSKEVHHTVGLVGTGAYQFQNDKKEAIDLGNGGGTALATGSFATTDGVSIEALIQPQWSGNHLDSDEIFRKDMEDSNMRLLFCLQHDGHKKYAIPQDYRQPALSFGLYLIGEGYHELKLPLDGRDGRPTLESLNDGKPHHVVATYDVRSGLKGIYYDGKLLAHHNYPAGTKMVSGGPGQAVIGNYPGKMNEPFTGTIDEVAFYNFALTPFIVNYHYKNIGKGLNYYGLKPGSKTLPDTLGLRLPANRTMILDSLTGLPIKVKQEP